LEIGAVEEEVEHFNPEAEKSVDTGQTQPTKKKRNKI
jgi:hypothetical protein